LDNTQDLARDFLFHAVFVSCLVCAMTKAANGVSMVGHVRALFVERFIERPWRKWRHWPDVLGLLWIALFIFLYLSPAIKDGATFGPADLGRAVSLLTKLNHAGAVHNASNGDIISQSIPWNTLDWRLVHSGQLPLWNSYSGTGLPQLLNWESAVFSLPTIIGYAMPLSLSFIVSVAIKLLIASTGAYALCRLLGCRPLSASFGGTAFMLAGNLSGWLGWAISGPFVWTGWIVAACVLAYRSRGRLREIFLLGVVTAFTVFSGFPEGIVLLAIGLLVLIFVAGLETLACGGRISAVGIGRLGAGLGVGAGLSAPLWLSGFPVLQASVRQEDHVAVGLPFHAALLIFAQGFDGLPIKGSYWFGPSNYYETAAYVGVVAIVFASAAAILFWRRPVVLGIIAAGVVSVLVVYQLGGFSPIQHLFSDVGLGDVAVQRMQPILEFAVAILAAIGLEAIVDNWQERRVQLAVLIPSILVFIVLGILWLTVDAARIPSADLPQARRGVLVPSASSLAALRRSSLLWPSISIAIVCGLVIAAMVFSRRPHKVNAHRYGGFAAGVCLLLESLFLLFAGVGINSYAPVSYPQTPSLVELQKIVGSSLVALDARNVICTQEASGRAASSCGVRRWLDQGIYPGVNIAYQIDELALHDPVTPIAYFLSWPIENAGQNRLGGGNLFAPAVNTARLARLYGASFVLSYPKLPPPVGTRKVATLPDGEVLYAVPNSAQFVFDTRSSSPSAVVESVAHPSDSAYLLSVDVFHQATLILHLTDSPGWHVAVDGHPVAIRRYDKIFMDVNIPSGARLVTISYWPSSLTYGFVLALFATAVLCSWFMIQLRQRSRSRKQSPEAGEVPRTRRFLCAKLD
jgi:hypothetical protein